jgi:hypothetical protein
MFPKNITTPCWQTILKGQLWSDIQRTELGASLFQIAQSLIALERILFSRAKERFKKKIEER